ncbi:amino acid adenylation domain-containing protein [Streptomyces sp. NBC_00536]|uniref:amino acid adenylation domain-containing protein n=1 Tax=Streptomyces sp. NBC_00536 TaxID=2975769 RepID=UPI002E812170|nr:amino acid adenylation domain-containing protein [Streptomyces sp. NBC_00536]WUC77220.1 amino acid adenylation domain-containing protein [Streptomyces sp. NBC_00536]
MTETVVDPAGRADENVHARPVAELFFERARRYAERLAVDEPGGTRYTYAELALHVREFASGLRSLGVTPGAVVAVAGSRGPQACVALLGVVCAGATYLPLDPTLPAARVTGMLEDAEALAVVRLPGAGSVDPEIAPTWDHERILAAGRAQLRKGEGVGAGIRADVPAYVMFTSGTTGRPKAVPVPQRGLVRLSVGNGFFDVRPTDRVLHAATLSFDASVLEMWPALLNGACLVPADSTLLLAPYALAAFLREQEITVLFATTSVFHHIAHERPETFAGLRYVLTGGEALRPDAARRVLEQGRPERLINAYGPTETACVAVAHQVEAVPEGATGIPIGRPIADTVCLVLREDGTRAGPGEEGELWIGGPAVAAGYLGNPAESARRFVTLEAGSGNPESGAEYGAERGRFYRTGDFVRRHADGEMEFCGRRDDQVKVRGFRIEPDEIRDAVATHPAITDSVVLAREDGATRHLALFAAATRPGRHPDVRELRAHLAERLPAFMVPATITVLDRLPLAANGKVDRAALLALAPSPATGEGEGEGEGVGEGVGEATAETIAALVSRIWEQTLPQDVSHAPDDDFFVRGGNSLIAAQLVNTVQAALSIGGAHSYRLVGDLLNQPTLKAFIVAVEATVHDRSTPRGAPVAGRWLADLERPVPRVTPVPITAHDRPDWRVPRHVLLTGASGFLGAHLLRTLLDRTDAELHLLVRARDLAHAHRRIARAQRRHGITRPLPAERIHPLLGDLAAPRLGLTEAEFDHQAARADVIHHCGADVNFLYPYEQLRPANVDGTGELIALAARRAVPLHYVSTIGVVHGFGAAGVREVSEDTQLDHVELLSMGYTESKWIAEELLRKAARAGLPVAVHRPHEITGDTLSHTWDSGAALCELFKVITELGLAPDLPVALNFVPVDHVAASITHLATHREAQGQTYHHVNPREALLADLVQRLRVHGHRIETVGYHRWTGAMEAHLAERPGHSFAPFAPRFTTLAAGSDLTLEELCTTDHFPALGRERIDADLAGSGLSCPPVDAAFLDACIGYFHASGFIPSPAG